MAGQWVLVMHNDQPAPGAAVRLSKAGLKFFSAIGKSLSDTWAITPMIHSTVLAVHTSIMMCDVCSNHPEWPISRIDFNFLLQLKSSTVQDEIDDADGTHSRDADPVPSGQADRHTNRHADGPASRHANRHADGRADGHADGHADAEAGRMIVDNAGAHVCGECTGQGQVQHEWVISNKVHEAAVTKHKHRQALRLCDELDLNCKLTENSVCCCKRCRSQLSLFWHFVEEIMQNIIRDHWNMAHIDMSEARMLRPLQGYVVCDVCFTDDEWDRATNGLVCLTFSGVRPASPVIAQLNLQPGDINQTKHVGEQLAAIMAERQPLQLVASQDNSAAKNNALLGPQGTMAIGMATAIGSAFAALCVA